MLYTYKCEMVLCSPRIIPKITYSIGMRVFFDDRVHHGECFAPSFDSPSKSSDYYLQHVRFYVACSRSSSENNSYYVYASYQKTNNTVYPDRRAVF